MALATTQTVSSKDKLKPPVAYSSIVRRMTSRVNQLHDELALESVTNIEFEQSSRRSFEFLQGQVRTMKEAFNTLTDTILEELDYLSSTTRSEMWRLDERQAGFEKHFLRDCQDLQLRQQQQSQQLQQMQQVQVQQLQQLQQQVHGQMQQQLTQQVQSEIAKQQVDLVKHQQDINGRFQELKQELNNELQKQQERHTDLEKRAELMAQDLDTVLSVVPKVEDTMLKTTSHLQERIAGNTSDVAKLNDAMAVDRMKATGTTERLEARMRSMESDLREEIEQRHLKLQRSITRQLESMSKALIENDRPAGLMMPGVSNLAHQDVGFAVGSGGAPLPHQHTFGQRQVDFDMSVGMHPMDAQLHQGTHGGFNGGLRMS
eukprot:TRINITY_DN5976_c0_g1_i1.p1 TRINITY_DN5976_c0_g1~~TRINITY_DN5976_c0_g1_i1.p1  ORF type:complete len:374 (-),score=119.64 TRINITY_DN5976_c0_g1_i1:33-1154(-)